MKKTISTLFIALLIAGATSVKAQGTKIDNSKKVENKAVSAKTIKKKANISDAQLKTLKTNSTTPVKAKAITPSKAVSQPVKKEKATLKTVEKKEK